VEPEEQAETPVRDALRHLSNRPGQFDYLSAIKAHLPIGSGEVESAHRYLIQKRLKLPPRRMAARRERPSHAQPPFHARKPTMAVLLERYISLTSPAFNRARAKRQTPTF
jgi:hypothetical protein